MIARRLALLVATTTLAARAAEASTSEWSIVAADVDGALSTAIVRAVPEHGSVVAAHVARVLMWQLDLRREVARGDRVVVAWRPGTDGDPEIGAVVYRSLAKSATLRAYRWKRPGDAAASYWDEQGHEVPRRLRDSPLADYDQITALLKDRPTHQGMDFKTAVGTPVRAPRAGVVSRVDWKRRGNGRCLELRFDDDVRAMFLHLSRIDVRAGARVRAGQLIAATGNTGRSTAPHLHYQLARGGRTLDPIDYHGTARRTLDGATRRSFDALVASFKTRLPL